MRVDTRGTLLPLVPSSEIWIGRPGRCGSPRSTTMDKRQQEDNAFVRALKYFKSTTAQGHQLAVQEVQSRFKEYRDNLERLTNRSFREQASMRRVHEAELARLKAEHTCNEKVMCK